MTVEEIVRLLFERSNAMQSFWGFYITIAIGLLAAVGTIHPSASLTWVLSIAFVLFAVFNAGGLVGVANQRRTLYALLESKEFEPLPASVVAIRKASAPPPLVGILSIHFASDIGVLVAMWLLSCR